MAKPKLQPGSSSASPCLAISFVRWLMNQCNMTWKGPQGRENVDEMCIPRQVFQLEITELVLSIHTHNALLPLLPDQSPFSRNRKLPHALTCHLIDKILSQELLSLLKGQANSGADSPVSCVLFLRAFLCHAACEIENFPCKALAIV